MTKIFILIAALVRGAINLRIKLSEKGAANGVATLDASGKVPDAQLPDLAITDTFDAADEAAMLALTAQKGDVALRLDVPDAYILSAEPASVLANWKKLPHPVAPVTSVAGKIGAVVLVGDDITDLGSYTEFETEFNNGLL